MKTYNMYLKIASVSMFLAPVCLLLGDLIWLQGGLVAEGTFVRWLSYVFLVPAVIGLTHLLQGRSGTLALWAGGISLTGIIGGTSILTLYRLGAVMETGPDGVPLLLQQVLFKNPLLPATIFLPGSLFPLSLIIFGIAVLRSQKYSFLPGLALILTGPLFWVGNALDVEPVLFLNDLILLGVFAWAARQVWPTPQPEADTVQNPPVIAS
ncbi:hypothetical protein [Telluribacter humicola]|uniref:hypothetical protein n=1 Tax=Telluribacter humicola TaxID=1720261 RepID=UPI001A958643|nr:hypothetical protein [Telluribacter humicola]